MWIPCLFIVNLLPLVVTQDDSCLVNNLLQETTCIEVADCAVAIKQLKETHGHNLKPCGFNGLMQMVCCPQTTRKFGKSGDNDNGTETDYKPRINTRIAERECNKILNTTIPFLSDHILNGERAAAGEFPHMVGLGYLIAEQYEFDCGGSLVSLSYVLTAGHCVGKRIKPTIVRAGVIEIGKGEWNSKTDVRIAEIIKHPNFTWPARYHDLALLRLEKPFKSSNSLNAICLETNNADPEEPLVITGWGRTDANRYIRSNTLLKANITVVARVDCNESYSSYDWKLKLPLGIITQQICAIDPEGRSDTCYGDSGGPLMTTTYRTIPSYPMEVAINRLVGLTSFGKGCGSRQPALYTRVSSYLDWIEGIVWPN